MAEKENLYEFFKSYFKDNSWENITPQEDLLVNLVDLLRPKKIEEDVSVSLNPLIYLLKDNNDYRKHFSTYINALLKKKKFHPLISDAGIPVESDFFFEVKEKLFAKFLPRQPERENLEYLLNQAFYKTNDPIWIEQVEESELKMLFQLLEFKEINSSVELESPLSEILFAFEIITLRICGNALESKVMRMVPEYSNLDSPFVAFQNDLSLIAKRILKDKNHYLDPEDEDFKHMFVLLKQCEDYIKQAFKNSKKYGISLRANQDLIRIKRQLLRLKEFLPLLAGVNKEEMSENSINLAKQLIKLNCYRNNLKRFFDDSTRRISYEITEQTAKTGEHYITEDKSGYFKMLLTSMGGGLIVGLMCLPKVVFAKFEVSAFTEALLYSLNYSIGFVILYLLGFTLATKQPAMTASTLISALEKGLQKGGPKRNKHKIFAKLFSEVFRSQFVAFVGNVIMAFPVALLVSHLIHVIFDYNIPQHKWETLINDLNPSTSLAILHAGIAGIFLFLAGIIAGGISNRNKYNNVYERIGHHPFLKRKLGKKTTLRIAKFVKNKWAGIMSNAWFGIFMGSTASLGIFFGLNLDVRHIAFSSGNFALGLFGSGYELTSSMVAWSLFGIFVIGFMNFWVSFGLSILVAFRSRRIPVSEFKAIVFSVLNYFIKSPADFLWPPKGQTAKNILKEDEDNERKNG